MNFTVYSIGDAAYLETILNAVAAIFQSGKLANMYAIGLLIGVLVAALRGLIAAGGIRFQDILIAFVLFECLFVPTARVTIVDTYTGAVRVVDHVPLGPAAGGGIISAIGVRVTELFEQAFSTPSMVQEGYAAPLDTLVDVRKRFLSRIELGRANAPGAGVDDVERSFINYVKDCTLTGVDKNIRSMDDIMREPDPMTALRYPSDAFGTRLYLGPSPTERTCTEAWNDLSAYVSQVFAPALVDHLAAGWRIPPADVGPKIQSALSDLALGAASWQDYVVMAAIVPFFEKGIAARHMDSLHWTAAAMVEQAVQQRNAQWTAQASLFSRYVRPMMTFVEGFAYAITPLIAFAVMFGPIGFRIAGVYFMLNLWIQLWMPSMAIVNLFVNLTANNGLDALQAAQYQFPSMLALYKSDLMLQDWLAVGGVMASTVPALSFMLLSGSAIAVTHMMGRLQAGDPIDETQITPPVSRLAPTLSVSERYASDPYHGFRERGAEQYVPHFDAGRSIGEDIARGRERAVRASTGFMASAGLGVDRTVGERTSASELTSYGRSIQASDSAVDRFVSGTAQDLSRQFQSSGLTSDQFSAVLGVGLGGAIGAFNKVFPKGTPEGGEVPQGAREALRGFVRNKVLGALQAVTAGGTGQYQLTEQTQNAIADRITEQFSNSQDLSATLAHSVQSDSRHGVDQAVSIGLDAREMEGLQAQAQDVVSTSDSLRELTSLQQRYGLSGSYNLLAVGKRIGDDPGLFSEMAARMGSSLWGDTQRLADQLREHAGVEDWHQAQATAGLMLMTGYAKPGFEMNDLERRLTRSIGYELLGRATYADTRAAQADPAATPGWAADAPVPGAVREAAGKAGLDAPDPGGIAQRADAIRGRADGTLDSRADQVSGGEGRVEHAHADYRDAVTRQATALQAPLDAERIERIGNEMVAAGDRVSWTEREANLLLAAKTIGWNGLQDAHSSEEAIHQRIGERVETIRGKLHEYGMELTPAQESYLRAKLYSPLVGGGEARDELERSMVERFGDERGHELAEAQVRLIDQAARTERTDGMVKIGRFNAVAGLAEYRYYPEVIRLR